MKIKPEHYAYIKRAYQELGAKHDLTAMSKQYEQDGLTPMRFRWDCSSSCGLSPWLCDNVYTYANDTHIDTAVRQIMREMGIAWASEK